MLRIFVDSPWTSANTPPRVSIATQALFAPEGSLWIRNTAGRGIAHVWTVFDRAGNVKVRLSLPAGFDLLHVRDNRLYGVTRTENDPPWCRSTA